MKQLIPFLPGIFLFIFSLLIGIAVYQDYGITWDEKDQRQTGLLSWNYAVHGDKTLFNNPVVDNHGAAYELLLISFEKALKLTDTRDIYLMRHIVTHLFFLLSAILGYFLFLNLFRNHFIACLGFVMIVFSPRIFAQSFFNSKDVPFLSLALIVFSFCQLALSRKKALLFLALGIAVGFATSTRIMGIMYLFLLLPLMFADFFFTKKEQNYLKRNILRLALFLGGFCCTMYLTWPYLWPHPVANFCQSFVEMAKYNQWGGAVFFRGKFIGGSHLPLSYFPVWFSITTPVLWLALGLAGIVMVLIHFFRRPQKYLLNSTEQQFLFYIICFVAPVASVMLLHSIIYDDWRHLYFVYPPFVLLGLYCASKLIQTKFKPIIWAACAIQGGVIGYFMVNNHPFEQVYFNELVSHKDEYLRYNYEMDYWGSGYKQEMEYLLANDTSKIIKICNRYCDPLFNNLMMLKPEDRARFMVINYDSVANADYYLANFRSEPEGYPSTNIKFSVSLLNSTILRIYKLK